MHTKQQKGTKTTGYILATVIILVLFGVLLHSPVQAADRDVCATCPYTTIQSSINAAATGDRVRVAQGTYYEHIHNMVLSRNITISGGWSADFNSQVHDPSLTVVDGSNTDRVLVVGGNSVFTLQNITLQNGTNVWGACISANTGDWLKVNLEDVIVQDCTCTGGHGGGISMTSSGHIVAKLTNVIVRRCSTVDAGGGIWVGSVSNSLGTPVDMELSIINSLIYSNEADREAGGIGIWAQEKTRTEAVIINSTIIGNTSHDQWLGGGGLAVSDGYADPDTTNILRMYNTILYGNTADRGADFSISVEGTRSRVDTYNCNINGIYNYQGTFTQTDNQNTDPLFVDPVNNDYHLSTGSPCIDTGTNNVPGLPALDFEGDSRVIDGDQDSVDTVDIGADEFIPDTFSYITLLSPNGRELIPSGTTHTIQWGAPEEAVRFKIKLSMNNGKKWKILANGIMDTEYPWDVPTPSKNKNKCLVKVIGYDDSNKKVGKDKSDRPFTIEGCVKLTSPNGDETLTSGTPHLITWDTRCTKPVAKVILKYSKNGGRSWKKITKPPLTEDTGSYDWQVPCAKKDKASCKVKIILLDASGNIVGEDVSDRYFTIARTCTDIGGDWNATSKVTVTCEYDGQSESGTFTGSETIFINQNDCNINWTVPGTNVKRSGIIWCNEFKVSGIFCMPEMLPGATFTTNQLTTSGTVNGDMINLKGWGQCSGTYQGVNFTCHGKDKTVLTRSLYGITDEKQTAKEPKLFMNNSLRIFDTVLH